MKTKVFITLVLVFIMIFSFTTYAAEYSYDLDNISVTSTSVSVNVENLSDADWAMGAKVYFALYNEYDILVDVKSQMVNIAQGSSDTITEQFNTNSITTIKAFVWESPLVPGSKRVYKTTKNNGNIEFGGEV